MCIAPVAYAQTAMVRGQIIVPAGDAIRPLLGAKISALLSDSREGVVANTMLTDAEGRFGLSLPLSVSRCTLQVSMVGYKVYRKTIDLPSDVLDMGQIVLEEDTVLLSEVRAVQGVKSQAMDHRSYLFSTQQRAKAHSAQQLVAQLPGFRLDPVTNCVALTRGGDIMYLMNGVPISESVLRSLPQRSIRRAIVYDVPPTEYHATGYLVNLIVEPQNGDLSGDISVSVGTLFEALGASLARVNGRSMWSLDLSSHINPCRIYSYQNGVERFDFSARPTEYGMHAKAHSYGYVLTPSLSYLYSGSRVRAIATVKYGRVKNTEESDTEYTSTAMAAPLTLALTNRLSNHNVEGDVYAEIDLKDKRALVFNNNTKYNANNQVLEPVSNGVHRPMQELSIGRLNMVNELKYRDNAHPIRYTVGLRSMYTRTQYAVNDYSRRIISTGYGEISGNPGDYEYRLAMEMNHELNESPLEKYAQLDVTPQWMLGYKVSRDLILRYRGSVANIRPVAQMLANKSLKVSPFMYRQGNPYLRKARKLDNEVLLRVTRPVWQLDWALKSSNVYNPILPQYITRESGGEESMIRKLVNGNRLDRYATAVDLNLSLLDESLKVGLGGTLEYVHLLRQPDQEDYKGWFGNMSASLSYNYRNWNFSYYHILFGREFANDKVIGAERVSDLSVGYRVGNFRITGHLYFPFTEDKVQVETIDHTPYHSMYTWHMKGKERTFGINVSWFFGDKSKRLDSKRSIKHADYNSGSLSIM